MPKNSGNPADYIVPLEMNGLSGRMLSVPAKRKGQREILLVYGHHAMLERWWGLVENLNTYGTVTMPDLPGFGGMESFSKIKAKPTIDAYADYLATFIKLRYKKRRISVFGISFGFIVVTRMLQRYPELAKQVDILVSLVGFVHHNDFIYTNGQKRVYRKVSRFFAARPNPFFIRRFALNGPVLRSLYVRLPNSKKRMIEITPEEFDISMEFEVKLWQANDVRTHWLTTREFLSLDNTKKAVNLPVVHVISMEEHYFNNVMVEEHMRKVFKDYTQYVAKTKAHTPSVIADKKAMSVLLPPELRKRLSSKEKLKYTKGK